VVSGTLAMAIRKDRTKNWSVDSENRIMSAFNVVAKGSSWPPHLLSVVRIVAAFMFIQAGTMKLFAFPVGVPPNGGTVPVMSQLGLGAILETFGGALLLVGLFTRPVAFLLAGEMAVAYFQFHFPKGFWPVMNGGVPAVLYCFVWLYISAAGAGPWSLDAKRGR
jgi:putative oxidoreductase